MKLVTFILLFLSSCYLSFDCNAEEPKQVEANNVLLTYTPKVNRPRIPSNVYIMCSAFDGILTFTPSDYYVTLYVTVENEDTGESWEGIITDGNMSMEYSTLPGSYSITCVNESDIIFEGAVSQ